MKKNKITKITVALLALCMCLNVGMNCVKAEDWDLERYYYNFSYNNYGEDSELVSDLAPKYSNGSMTAYCESATHTYTIHAVGLYHPYASGYNARKEDVVDVSNGYSYYMYAGMSQNNIYNWAYEWGYNYAGLAAIYQGDGNFSSSGYYYAY